MAGCSRLDLDPRSASVVQHDGSGLLDALPGALDTQSGLAAKDPSPVGLELARFSEVTPVLIESALS